MFHNPFRRAAKEMSEALARSTGRAGGTPLPLLSRSARSQLKGNKPLGNSTKFEAKDRNGSRECARRAKQLAKLQARDK